MTETKTKTARIGIRAFPYYVDGEDPVTGRAVRTEKIASRGDEVELSELDYKRAERFGALASPEDESGGEVSLDQFSAEDATPDQIAQWLRQETPNQEETVDAANGDAATAQKILEGENLATGGEPRKGVVSDLQSIIDGG